MSVDGGIRVSVPAGSFCGRTIRAHASSYYVVLVAQVISKARQRQQAIICGAMCLLLLAGSCSAAPPDYIQNVSAALDSLESGKTAGSVDSLKKAISFNANDSLAHTTMGLTLLLGGRRDDALVEFNLAAELGGNCAEAIYGRALVDLSKREYGLAVAYFCEAQTLNPELDMRGSIEYAKALASGTYADIDDPGKDDSLLAIKAFALMKSGKYSQALPIWREAQPSAARADFAERIGCSMTFWDARPVSLTGWPLKTGYKAPAKTKENGAAVSGSVMLRADLSKAPGVRLVSFLIDNKLTAVTNQQPYCYSWNTEQVSNGMHTVKILGADEYGNVLTEKVTTVLVKNAGAKAPSARVIGDDAARVWARLWELMKLKPSAAAINYNLAVCALAESDTETAEAALERVLAADPDYLDAGDRLAGLYGSGGKYEALHKGNRSDKVIALTFDDGPKENTGQLLDALKEAGVKATFFVVGKQAEHYPELVKRMAAEGHEIENHTYNHRDLEYLTEREIKQEIFRNIALVRSITGKSMRCVRPPGGHEGGKLRAVTAKFGMPTVFWTTNCAKLEGTKKKKIFDYVVSNAGPGGIVLMHNAEIVTLSALPDIIAKLRERGYSFVTICEMNGGQKND